MSRIEKALLAVAGGMMLTALVAADELELNGNGVLIRHGTALAELSEIGLVVSLPNQAAVVYSHLIGAADGSVVRTYIDVDGVTFPDGSEQQSAAYSKSETDALLSPLAPVDAWPMVCKTDLLEGTVPPDLTYRDLVCRSPQGVPGGAILGTTDGVPAGYYFLVTGVLARCDFGDSCEGVFFRLTRRNVSNSDTDIETWAFPLSSTTPSGATFAAVQFGGPLTILEPGDYLVGLASLSPAGTHAVYAQVTGYLTSSPERFRP